MALSFLSFFLLLPLFLSTVGLVRESGAYSIITRIVARLNIYGGIKETTLPPPLSLPLLRARF